MPSFTIKLWWLTLCGIGARIDKLSNDTRQSPETDWWIYSTQEPCRSTGRKERLLHNGSGTIDSPH